MTPNDGKCHMEDNMYTHSTLLDYPSVSQINKVVRENSVNLIFAVTESELNIYEQLSAAVEGSSVGKLSQDSSNVVQVCSTIRHLFLSSDLIYSWSLINTKPLQVCWK